MASAGITLGFLAGCSADEKPDAGGETARLAISRISIGRYSADVATRADAGGSSSMTILKEGTVGISRASGGTVADNQPFAYGASSSWTAAAAKGILLSAATSQMAAYYPYAANGVYSGSGSNATLSMAACRYQAEKDLCAGTFTATADEYDPTPVLSHLYARISFRFVKQYTYTGAGEVKTFTLKSVTTGATYKLFERALGNTSTTDYQLSGITDVKANTEQSTIDLLIVPMSGIPAAGIAFRFHVDGTESKDQYRGTLPQDLFAKTGGNLQAGSHYKLQVLLGEGGFTIQGDKSPAPGVSDWNPVALSGDYSMEVDY